MAAHWRGLLNKLSAGGSVCPAICEIAALKAGKSAELAQGTVGSLALSPDTHQRSTQEAQ
jgi:hypothetical protein